MAFCQLFLSGIFFRFFVGIVAKCQGNVRTFVMEFWDCANCQENVRESSKYIESTRSGLLHVREKSGKFKFFQDHGVVGEFGNCKGNLE